MAGSELQHEGDAAQLLMKMTRTDTKLNNTVTSVDLK